MGVSILSIAVLSSCQKDEFIGNVIEKTTTYTMTAEINNNSDSRATVNENMEFLWHAHDALSVYDNTNNFKFSTINYFDDKQSNKAEFVGDAAFTDGTSEVTVIYPYKETDPTVLELPAEIEQTSDVPELKNTMFMAGKGKLNGNKIEEVTLNHLTALYHFKIKNVTGRMLKLKEVSVEADENIFPLKLTYSENSTSENKTNKLSIKFNDKEFADGNEINAYMNIFPTGDIKNKTLAFKVIGTDEENKERKYEALKGSVSALYPSTFTSYQKGKRYVVNLEITGDKEAGPDEGYDIDAEGKYHIYNAKGLMAWKAAVDVDKTTNAVLEKNIDMSNQDNWTPIAEYWGNFNGNNKSISNITIGVNNDISSFICENYGNINNLIFDGNLTLTDAMKIGTLAGSNYGKINSCIINSQINITIAQKATGQKAGGLVSENIQKKDGEIYYTGIITDSYVNALTIIVDATSGGQKNIGGIAADNTTSITGCYAKVNITTNKAGFVGGIVGSNYNGNGKIQACYSIGHIENTIASGVGFGGLAGQNAGLNSIIKGCYSNVTFKRAGKNIGGLVGKNFNGTISYSYSLNSTLDLCCDNNVPDKIINSKKCTNDELINNNLTEINTQIKDSGYMYEVNSEADKENKPLILKKVSE